FSSRRRHTRWPRDWSSDVCSSDLFDAVLETLYPAQPLASYGPADGPPLFRVCVSYAEQLDVNDRLADAVPGVTIRPFEAEDLIRSEERRVGKECKFGWAETE